jgi:hypothetical protein|tara:strand:- start:7621 stop:7779 length:159 start_codon:yes stop_codon:yes gene_type:complete
MTPDSTVPIKPSDLESIIAVIQVLLKDDEAGPAFYIVPEEWPEDALLNQDTK